MDKYILAKYFLLIADFVNENISVEKFEEYYLRMVKEEKYIFKDDVFKIIQTLFSDVDSYCSDEFYDPNDPDNINEQELRRRADETLRQLKIISK